MYFLSNMFMELGWMTVKRRAFCCLTHNEWSKGLYKCFCTSFVILSITWIDPSVFWSAKCLFFSLSLEPCINTESYPLCHIDHYMSDFFFLFPLSIWVKLTLWLLTHGSYVDKLCWVNSVNCRLALTCLPALVVYCFLKCCKHLNPWWLWNTWAESLWVSFRGIHFLPVSFTVVGTK